MKAFQTMISISQMINTSQQVSTHLWERMKDAMNADLLIERCRSLLEQGQDAMGIFMKSLLQFRFCLI